MLLTVPCSIDFLDACGQLSSSPGKVSVCHFEIIETFPGHRSRLSILHHCAVFPDPVYCLNRALPKGRAHLNTAVKYTLAILPTMPAARRGTLAAPLPLAAPRDPGRAAGIILEPGLDAVTSTGPGRVLVSSQGLWLRHYR